MFLSRFFFPHFFTIFLISKSNTSNVQTDKINPTLTNLVAEETLLLCKDGDARLVITCTGQNELEKLFVFWWQAAGCGEGEKLEL